MLQSSQRVFKGFKTTKRKVKARPKAPDLEPFDYLEPEFESLEQIAAEERLKLELERPIDNDDIPF
jgi:hypothetical protein